MNNKDMRTPIGRAIMDADVSRVTVCRNGTRQIDTPAAQEVIVEKGIGKFSTKGLRIIDISGESYNVGSSLANLECDRTEFNFTMGNDWFPLKAMLRPGLMERLVSKLPIFLLDGVTLIHCPKYGFGTAQRAIPKITRKRWKRYGGKGGVVTRIMGGEARIYPMNNNERGKQTGWQLTLTIGRGEVVWHGKRLW